MNTLFKRIALSVISLVFLLVHHVSGQTKVEGFVGGSVILPCTLTPNGELSWKRGRSIILLKSARGLGTIGDVSLVENSADLRINPLDRNRDGNTGQGDKIFECEYTGGSSQQIQLILLARITGVSMSEASDGIITVRAGPRKTLTCSVTGDPNPPPSYSWSVDGDTGRGQTSSSYTFTPSKDHHTKTIKCIATNKYGNGSVLSEKEATATLNVQFLDLPVIKGVSPIIENSTVTLQCSTKGNPQPRFEWRKSTSSEILHESALYVIENVQRSAAGTYRCTVINAVTAHIRATHLIVLYPPDVTVNYCKATHTVTCRAEGVPDFYTFSQWEHRLHGELLQTLGTQSSGPTATLKLPGILTYEDTGYYVCQVSNRIKSPQRGQVFVTPQSPAIFEKQTQTLTWKVGENNSISVPFYTYSDTPNVDVVWKKSGVSTVFTSHREETGPVRLMIHSQSVSIEGTVTVLTLRDVTQSDEGNYTVTVTNDINGLSRSNQITFSLFVTLLPTSSIVTSTNTSPISVGNDQANKQSGVEVAPIAGGAAGALILILVIVILFIVVRRRSVINKNTGQTPEEAIRPPEERAFAQFHNGRQEGGVYQDLTINPDYLHPTENQPYASLSENDLQHGQTPEEAIRPPAERIVAQFHNGPQEGGVYQDLTINPDYLHPTENQPYASLSENDREATERIVAQFHNGAQEGGVYQDLTINPDYLHPTDNQPYASLSENDREATDYEECDVHVIETKNVAKDSITTVTQYKYIDVYPDKK